MNDQCGHYQVNTVQVEGGKSALKAQKLFGRPISILVYLRKQNKVVKGWENPFDTDQICYMDRGVVMTYVPVREVKLYGGIGVYEADLYESTVFDPPRISNTDRVIVESIYGGTVGFGR